MVSPETLGPAIAVIERAGYRRFDPPPDISDAQLQLLMSLRKDLDFAHKETGLQMDLHWQLFLNPHAMDEGSVRAASRVVPLTGKMGLRTLGEEDLFTYLCVHGALITWRSLKWLADIGALLATEPEGGAERLYSAAEARGAGRAAAQAMLLCQRIFGTPLAAPLMTDYPQQPQSALAGTDGAERHDRRPWRARTALRAFRDDPRQPVGISSRAELALPPG